MKIKELLDDERPREKLLLKGAASLSGSELLAILLRTGTAEKNAVELGAELLRLAGGGFDGLASLSLERMMQVRGIGRWKAVELSAAIELGRRFFAETRSRQGRKLLTPGEVYQEMAPIMRGLQEEQCWALFLSSAKTLIAKEKVSDGGGTSTVVDQKKVCLRAIEHRARFVVLVHNHPSGSSRPGECDIALTGKLRTALRAIDTGLLDHVVVADGEYFSFADDRVYFPEF